MRRALLELLPAFAAVYGIHPQDVDDLTFAEVREFKSQIGRFLPRG